MDGASGGQAMVGAEGLHRPFLQDRPPRRRHVPVLHALARGERLLGHRRLPRDRGPRKLVATDSFADAKGRVVSATAYGLSAETPLEMLLTVTLEDVAGKTKLTLRHDGLPAGPDQEGAEQGWTESFERLAASRTEGSSETGAVTSRRKRQVVMSRGVNAPRDGLFRAYTDPELIPRWWGRRRQTTTVEAVGVRKGGRWRSGCRDPDGT